MIALQLYVAKSNEPNKLPVQHLRDAAMMMQMQIETQHESDIVAVCGAAAFGPTVLTVHIAVKCSG